MSRLIRKDPVSFQREQLQRIQAIEQQVQRIEASDNRQSSAPVLFFNPSSHLTTLNFNATAGLVMTWGLRVGGQPVVYLVCQRGLYRCVLGTDQFATSAPPPCDRCITFHNHLYPAKHTVTFASNDDAAELRRELTSLRLEELVNFRYGQLPIGEMCLPSVRWRLRIHSVDTTADAARLLADYVVSAVRLAQELGNLLERLQPRALLLFNGTFHPEATARAVAVAHGIPVVTYEGGYLPDSVFLTHGVATEYRIDIPDSFQMGQREQTALDEYLDERFRGDFSMVGARFWPEMHGIPKDLGRRIDAMRQVVSVFTNVVFDTSQVSANTIFESMFHWLDEVMRIAGTHPETLFVVRAHPDELRPGKESQETVEWWMTESGYMGFPNVVFIPPTQFTSSYELIGSSRFCLVYNSTIGVESTILGVPAIVGGRTRYDSESVVHLPKNRGAFRGMVTAFLDGPVPAVPPSWQERSRRYLYYSMFRAARRLSDFVESSEPPSLQGYGLKLIAARDLHPDQSEEMRIIYNGIVNGKSFH